MSEITTEPLRIWNKVNRPPLTALKLIQAGRLKNKHDINPTWRMQVMTETFGPCGIGWKYTIDKLWLERGATVKAREGNITAEEVMAFALVSVSYKTGEVWSEPVPGIGGSMFTEMEKSGPYNSDEAFKMAVTDALSVAFKALGVAAEIYLGNFEGSKYKTQQSQQQQQGQQGQQQKKEIKEPSDARIKLKEELSKALHGNLEEMADALRTYSSFNGTGKDGQPEVKYLTLANLDTPTENEKMHRWFGNALGKLRKDQAPA